MLKHLPEFTAWILWVCTWEPEGLQFKAVHFALQDLSSVVRIQGHRKPRK